MIFTPEYVDIPVGESPMRAWVAAPKGEGRYPGVLCYSDIFQLTVNESPMRAVKPRDPEE